MGDEKHYAKVIEWSDSIKRYIGFCPDLEIEVQCISEGQCLRELSELIKDQIKRHQRSQVPMPLKAFHASLVFIFKNSKQ